MTKETQWNLLIGAINKAAYILNMDLTERDMPDYMNWLVAREMNNNLWALIKTRGN